MNRLMSSRKILRKTSLYVTAIAVVTFTAILIYNYYVSKQIILEDIKENTRTLALSTLFQINSVLVAAQKMPENLSYILDCTDFKEEGLRKMLKILVENNEGVYGSTIAFEPYTLEKDKHEFAPYYYKDDGEIKYKDLSDEDYDYLKWEWYTEPKKLNKGVWSEPYFDKDGGNTFMVTYSQPFYKTIEGKKEFRGVVTCDISLDWLQELVTKIKIFQTGYAFVLSPKGIFIAHPNNEYYKESQSFFTLADKFKDEEDRKIGEKMLEGKTGYVRYYSHNKRAYCYLYYEPLANTGCTLGIVIPENELLFKLKALTFTLFLIGAIGNLISIIFKISLKKILSPIKYIAGIFFKKGSPPSSKE